MNRLVKQIATTAALGLIATSAPAQTKDLGEQSYRPVLKSDAKIKVQKKQHQPKANLKQAAQANMPEMQASKKLRRSSKLASKPSGAKLMTSDSANLVASSGSGQSMPTADGALAPASEAQGPQVAKQKVGSSNVQNTDASEGDSYLHLVMEVSKSGDVKVLSAVKAKGNVRPTQEALGDFIYHVSIDNKAVSLGSLQDPFELRAFPSDEHTGHHFSRADKARIIVKVPKIQLVESKLDTIKLDLFKLKPGQEIQKIDPEVFPNLQRGNRL